MSNFFDKQEQSERREAMTINHRTGNYRLEPFGNKEVLEQRPNNCYGCTYERLPNNGGFRLKFKHTLCYPQHISPKPEQAGAV